MGIKLELKDVEFGYKRVPVLSGVTCQMQEGEIFTLLGPNGSGKTTVLKCISGILKPKKGQILIDGKEIFDFTKNNLAKKVAYVPQAIERCFSMSVFEVALMGRRPHISWTPGKKDILAVSKILAGLGLEELAMEDVEEISGGERQKVLIARALAQEPEILLLDEPTNNLDLKHQLELMILLKKLVQEESLCAIMAMHDLNLAYQYTDKALMLRDGNVYASGGPNSVFTEGNIRSVYGVDVSMDGKDGKNYIQLVKPCEL